MQPHNEQGSAVTCVAFGTKHQGHAMFEGKNSQCMAMAAFASVFSSVNARSIFRVDDIDLILFRGDALYMSRTHMLPPGETYLRPEDLPTEINTDNHLVQIESLNNNWIINDLFPSTPGHKNASIANLVNILQDVVFNDSHNDLSDSYLFTGQNYTVAFWRLNNKFYLFNSHAVNELNQYSSNGVARLFQCNSELNLANLLFIRDVFGGTHEYSIHKIHVVNIKQNTVSSVKPISCTPTTDMLKRKVAQINESEVKKSPLKKPMLVVGDSKLDYKEPVVVLYDIFKPVVKLVDIFQNLSINNSEVSGTSTVKRGRPTKTKRGRKSTQINAHLNAVKKYIKSNPQTHINFVKSYNKTNPKNHIEATKKYNLSKPEVNRNSVKLYSQKNPNINRAAVARYSKLHPVVKTAASNRYNKDSRNIDAPLRRSTTLIAQMRDEELNLVTFYTLKNPSLLSPQTYRCSHCKARLFDEEKSRQQWCCGSGKHNFQNFAPLNEEFYSHSSFLSRPRAYNNLFAFSALGVEGGYQQPDGISFLKIQGRIYHRVFDLAYTQTDNNLRLYIINDPHERDQLALKHALNVEVVRSIRNFLDNVNPFINCFKRLSLETSDEAFIVFQKTTRATHGNILGDLPGREVAALISPDSDELVNHRIALWKIGAAKPHTVDIMHPLYEAFQYPLLYPEGNEGWYPNKHSGAIKITQVKYVRCLVLSEPRFTEFGRLSEEWLLDMYCRVTEERLRYLKHMQQRSTDSMFRTAPLQEVEMSVVVANQIKDDETIQGEGFVAGRIYLPYSFTGGPRYMKAKYNDAIAIVSRLGNPSFFLTFTCNPNWPEIKNSILPGRGSNPAITARVFQLKLLELLRDIRSGRWFGECVYIMHVIEFQKRGLPHAHVCFRVAGGGPANNVDIDKFVRADIPNELEAGGRLRKAVLDHMVHGPCGTPLRTGLPCWDTDKKTCAKFFPKRANATTFVDTKGFINFRRDVNNVATIKYRGRDIPVNDTWIVPYNASLLLKYDAHINLEVSSQRTVIKYLFKYITKGPDYSRVAVTEQENINEIEDFQTQRYLGSCDAAWRTFEFDVTAREPNVKMLSVHLENKQTVYFKPGTEADVARRASSDLITYFNRPLGEEFDRLTYLDFYEQYLVHSSRPSIKTTTIFETQNNKFVTKRQRGELVARLFWVSPQRGEQFYLRILLSIYPCRSYADLLKLGGPSCTTFQEAAKFVGLADDKVEYEKAMLEASSFLTGPRLRSFFVLLAINGAPVATFWDTFKNQLSEDISHRLPEEDEAKIHTLCLIEINRMLRKHGSDLKQYGLPEVTDHTTELSRERVEYNRETLEDFVSEWSPKLSSDQHAVYDYVVRLCTNPNFRESNNTALFLDGPAGTGKTMLLTLLAALVRGNLGGVVLCVASSAIAAQNYEGGTTAHSLFKFPLEQVDDREYWNITNGSQRAELIYNADLIIYDEAPMAHKFLINILDRSLRDLMKNDKIFGGKIIIFAGDFRQIPPVVVNAKTNSDILRSSVKTSQIWSKLKSFSLTTSQRCKDDKDYADFLLKLGSNKLPTRAIKDGNNTLKLIDLSCIETVSNLIELIDFVFPFLEEPCTCIHRAILCTRNDSVKEINDIVLDCLEGEILHFYSNDSIDTEHADEFYFGPDALNSIEINGVPPHDLKLKINCVCMITRNLSFTDGLINGTKVIVTAVSPRLITVQKSNSTETYFIPRITFKAPIEHKSAYQLCRRQFPLQVCYAMTIHKSQGQTISRVGLDLRSDIFTHGQLYVALGRVTERRHIKILIHKDRYLDGKPFANNVIIKELL